MITDAALQQHRADAARWAELLTEGQRRTLAVHALTLANIRSATIADDHWNTALDLLAEVAPSAAAQIRHMTKLTDILESIR